VVVQFGQFFAQRATRTCTRRADPIRLTCSNTHVISPRLQSRLSGVLLVALSATCFAAMPVFARTMYADGGDPSTLLLLRSSWPPRCCWYWRADGRRPTGPTLGGLILLGALYVCQSLAYFTALTMTAPRCSGYWCTCTGGRGLARQRAVHIPLTRARVVSLAIALAGAALTIGPSAAATGWELDWA